MHSIFCGRSFHELENIFYLWSDRMVHGNPVHLAGRTAAGRSAVKRTHLHLDVSDLRTCRSHRTSFRASAPLPCASARLFYGAGIMLVEFISGSILRLFSLCPWDYSKTPYNISGLVRLDYFPVWFTAGLIFEYILSQKKKHILS